MYIHIYICVCVFFVNDIFFYFHMPARKPHASTCFLHNGNRLLLGGCFDMFFRFLILFLISGSQLYCFPCFFASPLFPAGLLLLAFLPFSAFPAFLLFLLLCSSLLFFCLSFCKLTLRSIIQYTNPKPI